MTKSVLLEFRFSSAHLYHQPAWSIQKNKAEFGLCFSEFGHGHNYRLQVIVPDSKDVLKMKERIQTVVDLLEHKHLNFEVEDFKKQIPTSEMIVRFFDRKLLDLKPVQITVFEDETLGASKSLTN